MTPTLSEGLLGPADLSGLLALEAACFTARERWSAHSWQAELVAPGRRGLAVREGRGLAAACLVSVVLGDAELLRIGVAPDHRGAGLAGRLLARSLAWAADRGADRMLLEVREDNTAARRLYARAGFARIHERPDYYGPGARALVLARALAPGTTKEESHD